MFIGTVLLRAALTKVGVAANIVTVIVLNLAMILPETSVCILQGILCHVWLYTIPTYC